MVAVTVRLTAAVFVELPLVPVTVMACAPEGNAMFAAVVMVKVTVIVWRGLPSSVTLGGLKLQSAPAGRFTVQLLGLDAVEFVKLTDPVKPLVGVMVSVEIALCPAGMLKLDGLADMVNGAATVTVAGEDVEGALIPL